MKNIVSPQETPPPSEIEAFGIMIQARTQRELDLTLALVGANRSIAALQAEIEAFKAEVVTLRAQSPKVAKAA